MKKILITGGCGFLGSHLVDFLLDQPDVESVTNIDSMTYAGNQDNNARVSGNSRYYFHQRSISDLAWLPSILTEIDWVFHLAAETHVDNSILNGWPFVQTNITGTAILLELCRLAGVKRFLHVSTDEVYGSIPDGQYATEDCPFRPSSPYSASKAAADLLVQAWIKTYNFPALIVRPSNCYGPRQHPEKLIPKAITNILAGQPVPIYGHGQQVRDWLYVDDLVQGLWAVMTKGQLGQAYNLPGSRCLTNLQIIQQIRDLMGNPTSPIQFVADRPGHDQRYAMTSGKILELGFERSHSLIGGLTKAIDYYRQKFPQKVVASA